MTMMNSVKGFLMEINFQEEALHLEKRRIKLMKERLMKNSQVNEDEDCTFLMSLLPSIKKTGRHSKVGTQNRISDQCNQENSNY
jgi:hypothetical protein